MSTHVQQAVDLWNGRFNCAQSVFAAYAPALGLEQDAAVRVAAGFGGGIARTGRLCGALAGAIMAIGLRHGSADGTDGAAKMRVYELSNKAMKAFAARCGSVECRDLLGVDLSTSDGQAAAKAPQTFSKCPGFVRAAAEVLEEVLGPGWNTTYQSR